MSTYGGKREGAGRKIGAKTIFRMQLIELGEEFDTIVGQAFPDIVRKLVQLALTSPDENIQFKAATFLTNHIVGLPVQRIDQTVETSDSDEVSAARQLLQAVPSQAGE